MHRSREWRAGLLATVAVMASAGAAFAQTAGDTVDEVVVTAQKREERLQDVPLSVAVVSSETLQAFNLNETTDIQHLVPGVTLISAAGPRNFGFFVRGIGTSSFSSESIEGSTAYVLDGVVLGQSGSALSDLPDVERVEVLRGPQGTLFGKNASAGVISVTTERPSAEFTARLSASWADPQDERRITGVVSGPLGDKARFLLSARANQRDGYVRNVFDGRKLNDREDGGVRAKLELTPVEKLDVTFIADYWKRDAKCCIWTLYKTGPNPSLAPERQSIAAGIVPGPNNLSQNINGRLFSKTESYGTSVQANYELAAGHTLTSITAYRRFIDHDGLDSDSSPLNLLDANFADFKQAQVTQELRITSPQGGFVDYVAGAFYFDGDVTSHSVQVFPSVPLPFFSKLVTNRASTTNLAIFGQANFNLSDDLRLIAGARAIHEEAKARKDRRDPVLGLTSTASASKTDDALLWRLGAQYDFTGDIMGFATVTRGYKGGGYDTNIGIPTLPDVQPEEPTNFELGLRTTWPEQRLILNVTAFHTKIDGYQAGARDPGPPPITRVFNGEGKTKGFEFDLMWRPVAGLNWTLIGSGAYVDARWGDFANAPCFPGQTVAQGCVGAQQDLTDARLPFSPKWSGNVGSHFETEVAGDLTGSFDLGLNFRTKAAIAFPNDPNTVQGGYTLVNAAVGLASADDHWKVSVFAKNLTDERYSLVYFSTPFGTAPGAYSQFIPYEAQRVVGASIDLAF
ncbi:TonB-dependent receptor [Phenylobacterium sp.]|uniref:TonB-dependent receptor n=1 Tax=Phenylobacterium sp. TaxID=1871053 RepID=UPI002FC7723A